MRPAGICKSQDLMTYILRPTDAIIIIITLFQEDNIFGSNTSLTYVPQVQRHTCV